jgi:hypothetical protein
LTLNWWTQPSPSSPSLQFWKTAECLGDLKRNATAYRTREHKCGATSPLYVKLRVEAVLPGCFAFAAVALVVALSAMLALGARAKDNRMRLWRLRKLPCHRLVVFLLLLENEVAEHHLWYWFYRRCACWMERAVQIKMQRGLRSRRPHTFPGYFSRLYTKLVPILALYQAYSRAMTSLSCLNIRVRNRNGILYSTPKNCCCKPFRSRRTNHAASYISHAPSWTLKKELGNERFRVV